MLITLLTLLLPYKVSDKELEFHKRYILSIYHNYFNSLLATGYKDAPRLKKIKKQLEYSVVMMARHCPDFLGHVDLFRAEVKRLKTVSKPAEITFRLPESIKGWEQQHGHTRISSQ